MMKKMNKILVARSTALALAFALSASARAAEMLPLVKCSYRPVAAGPVMLSRWLTAVKDGFSSYLDTSAEDAAGTVTLAEVAADPDAAVARVRKIENAAAQRAADAKAAPAALQKELAVKHPELYAKVKDNIIILRSPGTLFAWGWDNYGRVKPSEARAEIVSELKELGFKDSDYRLDCAAK
jgi:hypothetical protein